MDINFRKTVFLSVAAEVSQCPDLRLPEIVVVGRSNAGKSSFINALGDNRNLAKVSSDPGKTRNVVYFLIDGKVLLADLPGYGYSNAPKHEKVRYSSIADSYLSSARRFSLVIHCMDIRHQPTRDDVIMTQWVRQSDISYLAVLTKADKIPDARVKSAAGEFARYLEIEDERQISVLGNKQGIDEIRKKISHIV